MKTIEWRDGSVRFLDQTLLPGEETYVETADYRVVAGAIRALAIRGAPLIGIAAAYGVVLAVREGVSFDAAADLLAATRPTAVNLFSALERMRRAEQASPSGPGAADRLLGEARAIHAEDERMCAAIGRHGAALLPDPAVVVTHCNAGALATGGIGTALGVIVTAAAAGKKIRVYAGETRPLFQGARLTAWELDRAGIDVTVLTDGSVPYLMSRTRVDAVVIGADRIAANGDVANKIGSYGLARAAAEHGVPFYVAAPGTTVDPSTPTGAGIPIEERAPSDVAEWEGKRIAAPGVKIWAPAFDVTPAQFVTAIITETGVHLPPYRFGPPEGVAGAGGGGR
jgi:methylthioribose-1-phosphate isomerase